VALGGTIKSIVPSNLLHQDMDTEFTSAPSSVTTSQLLHPVLQSITTAPSTGHTSHASVTVWGGFSKKAFSTRSASSFIRCVVSDRLVEKPGT
jgi:hypothetical protein